LEEAAREWLKPKLDKSYINYGESKMMELTHFDGYAMLDATEFGAQWQKEQMITKACNYLFSHMGLFVTFFDDDIVEDIERSEFIKKFRIAMEDKL
jgi:hypothetical protein